jgi:diguanylate cyclase (GGDEF)-like protein
VDGLKEINDTKGHLEGDKYLISLAKVLKKQSAKEGYFAARIGGDEFVLIVEGKTDEEIERCINAVREESGVKFSAGTFNDVPHGRQKSWDYLEFADMELYKEKKYKKRLR